MKPLVHIAPAAVLALAATGWAQTCGQYAWAAPSASVAPSSRIGAAMAYDAARDRLVLFGGSTNTGFNDETWEYDSSLGQWIQMSTASHPSARSEAVLVYDSARRRVVLFGGGGVNFNNDTWEWDGVGWSQRTATGFPAPRARHAMAYDPMRQRMIVYGGFGIGPTTFQDTWEYDPAVGAGGAWTQRTPVVVPGPRQSSAMAFDPARGRVMLFGGQDGGTPAVGTWEYDGSNGTWLNRAPASMPSNRYGTQLAGDPVRQRVLMFGGTINGTAGLADTWEWNGAANAWTQLAPPASPTARQKYAFAFDALRGRAVLFGGFDGSYHGDTWALSLGRAPAILTQPRAQSVQTGSTACLTIVASGPGLIYQWRRDGAALTPATRYSGTNARRSSSPTPGPPILAHTTSS